MTPPRLTITARITQIRAHLVRVKQNRERYMQASADLSVADQDALASTRDTFTASVRELGWQWENIEAVLDALAPEK